MGSGKWSDDLYSTTRAFHTHTAAAKGITTAAAAFAYHTDTHSKPVDHWKVHELLDPRKIKGTRESRDSAEHPESVPVAVIFDVTGSMNVQPQIFQEKLPKLMTMLTTKGGIAHPQVLFGALDDAYVFHPHITEPIWFQVGQFESDNRCDEQLRNLILVGHGGGQNKESYDLALYFAAYKTTLDSLEKRGKKGYLFTLGDEMYYPAAKAAHIEATFGDRVQSDLSIKEIEEAVQQKFEHFHIHVQAGSYRDNPAIMGAWRDLLGERLLVLEDSALVCELIASTVAVLEGADFHDVVEDEAVGKALAKVASGSPAKRAEAKGDLPKPSGPGTGKRL